MTRYELLERIGAGGMAEIFRGKAVAAGGFEKPVAIKRILPHLSQDARFVDLLIAEAKILSSLRHRNIVQIFDVGLGDDGQYFLVMEFVDGADLSALQQRLESHGKRMPMELSLYVLAAVCEALEHAHMAHGEDDQVRGLVHRDVSPSNVLISRSGEVKLTDFGIAKLPEEATGHGGVRGKFAYISPEQAANQHVDARSDVFSVGILLYELVTGRRLFSALPDFDALRAVREHQQARPRDVDPSIDAKAEAIIIKALAKRPEDRFDSAAELGAALRTLRYSMPETESDPASELARIVGVQLPSRAAKGKRSQRQPADFPEGHEPTVVRIQTVVGFTQTGLEVDAGRTIAGAADDEELRDSVTKLTSAAAADDDDEEDEETRTLDLDVLRAKRAASEAGEGAHAASRQAPSTERPTKPLPTSSPRPADDGAAAAASLFSGFPSIPPTQEPAAPLPGVAHSGPDAVALRGGAPASGLPGLVAAARETPLPTKARGGGTEGQFAAATAAAAAPGAPAFAQEPTGSAVYPAAPPTRTGLWLAVAAVFVCVLSFVLARFFLGTEPPREPANLYGESPPAVLDAGPDGDAPAADGGAATGGQDDSVKPPTKKRPAKKTPVKSTTTKKRTSKSSSSK